MIAWQLISARHIMTSRPNRINIDLGPYKDAWLAYCKANGVTSNQAFRQIAAKLTMRDEVSASHVPERDRESGPKIRRIIRLTQRECDYVTACASQHGLTVNRWFVSWIRARMAQSPQLRPAELEMLGRSNLILLDIARQLKRISLSGLTAASGSGADVVTLLRALDVQFHRHVREVGQVLANNVEQWRR
jgi:hypothetical protein